MKSSQEWYYHFNRNLQQKRIDWTLSPAITSKERKSILKSLQAWQLGETSDGRNLLRAATKFARKTNDYLYVESIKLFIKEEQKHGANLGRYLDLIGEKRISYNWGDALFRKIRYLNQSMEWWTLAVITVESTAQVFYRALHDATDCNLLQQICKDILIDEAYHIDFQLERFVSIIQLKNRSSQPFFNRFYKLFFLCTCLVVWFAHKRLFRAGGFSFKRYLRSMSFKSNRIFRELGQCLESRSQKNYNLNVGIGQKS